MALSQAVSSYVDSGTTTTQNDPGGNPVTYPVMTPVYSGDWIYDGSDGNCSCIGVNTLSQAEAEALRDSWIAAGGVA